MTGTTTANVCIVETLGFFDEDARREGEVISRTLKLSGKRPHYSYVRSSEELQAFMSEFGESSFRYLHLSCHGNNGTFFTTTDQLSSDEMVSLIGKNLKNRRLFVSACLATDEHFAKSLMTTGKCHSVLGPVGAINFDDAAIFWTAFYHLMVKRSRNTMRNTDIGEVATLCAQLIQEDFLFFHWSAKRIVSVEIKGKK
jgi:hypothetical protein